MIITEKVVTFLARPERLWGRTSILQNGYNGSIPGAKRWGPIVDLPPHLARRLKKKYSYTTTLTLRIHSL